MPRARKVELSFAEKLRRLNKSGLHPKRNVNFKDPQIEKIDSIDQRIERIFGILNSYKSNASRMIYFIMYDIESNKIRNYIAKYLIKKGCVRIQKSIFLAETERKVFQELQKTLKEVQDLYENDDSILFVPVSVDEIRNMKMVGQIVDIDFILQNRSTMFI